MTLSELSKSLGWECEECVEGLYCEKMLSLYYAILYLDQCSLDAYKDMCYYYDDPYSYEDC